MADITQVLEGHEEAPNLLQFGPDGQMLVSASEDALKVWDVESGALLHDLPGHQPIADSPLETIPPTAIAFSPDGQTLATTTRSPGRVTAQHSLILWDLDRGEPQHQLAGQDGCQDVAFSAEGDQLWAACGSQLQRWSVDTGTLDWSVDVGLLEAIALSPDGQTLATVEMNLPDGRQDSTQVQLWTVQQDGLDPLSTLDGSIDSIEVEFSADGYYLVTQTPAIWRGDGSGSRGQVVIWDWRQQTPRYQHEHSGESAVDVGADGWLAGQFSESILIDLAGNPVDNSIIIRQQGGASAIALSPDGQTLAWAGQPPTFPAPIVRLWQAGAATEPTHESADGDRDQYTSVDLPRDRTTQDIEAFTRENFGLRERVEMEEETLTLTMPDTNRAEAILTLTSLADDSVFAQRYRLEFDLQEDGVTWELVWVGRQQQCRRGPTPEDEWTTQLCN
jgi:WD40 repeat protein